MNDLDLNKIREKHLTGVHCPICKTEMEKDNLVLTSDPAQVLVKCPGCGNTGYMTI